MKYYHVDVFSDRAFAGNGLTVVLPEKELSAEHMLNVTREFRQFETIFVFENNNGFPARIFTMDEELQFAGHPILGAAAVMHRLTFAQQPCANIRFNLSGRTIAVASERKGSVFSVTMNQGKAEYIRRVDDSHGGEIAAALGLEAKDLHDSWPIEVISTGLPYLLVPLSQGISRARINHNAFEAFLSDFGAKFVYVFDAASLECRTWDNRGDVEDAGTGSAAGPLCAYLVKNGYAKTNQIINIRQGRFVQRPCVIRAWCDNASQVFIQGDVTFFAEGELIE